MGHADDQRCDVDLYARASGPALAATVVLFRYELAVPAQDGVGRADRSDASELLAPYCLALDRQSSSLRVGQPKTALREVFFVHRVLGDHVRDLGLTTTLPPTSHGEDQEVQRSRLHRACSVA
jgi:hypothetical protein